MDLFDTMNKNDVIGKKKKNNNMPKIIIAAIIIILVIIIAIVGVMMYLQTLTTKFYVDGASKPIEESYFQITENGKIYISIQDIAKLLGTSYYNGEYGKISEDNSKGYVSFEEETVTFEANSNKIYKIEKQANTSEEKYSYMYLDEAIKLINGKLYTTSDGVNKILNVSFDYSNNNINIFTLEYLNTFYTGQISDYGYKEISEDFINQKAMKNNILILKREDNKMGILNSDGTEIVGAKYEKIQYIENTGDYMVTSGNKVGIINGQGKSKIDLNYEEIKVLDEDLGLYLVKQNNKYGVVNQTGNVVIYIENDEIGIDTSVYKDTNIKNPYLLFENCIPVKKGEKWGIYNKSGKLILPIEYDGLGCVVGTSSTKSAGNVITIDDYEGIVIQKDKLYGIINSTGTELIPCALDTIYSVTSSGVTTYKIEGTQNGQPYSYDLEKYFDAMNIKKVNRNTETKESEKIEDIGNTTNNMTNSSRNDTITDEDGFSSVDSDTEETSSDEDTLVVEQ